MSPIAGGRIDIEVAPDLRSFNTKLGAGLRASTGLATGITKGLGVAIAAEVGIGVVGLKKAIDVGMQYQQSLNELQAVTQATALDMRRVGQVAKDLGADMTLPATSAADAANAMVELAKGGLSVNDAMTAAKGTLQLAAAAQISAAGAAEIQANALAEFGLKAGDASHVADVLANTANAASGSIEDMANSLKFIGPVAKGLGVNIDSAATAIGLLANNGIKGEQAGTSLRGILASLAAPSDSAAKALKKLGIQAFDQQGKFVGLRAITEQLAKAKGTLTDQEFAAAAATAFGNEGFTAANALANSGTKAFDEMAQSVSRAGGAADVAGAKTKGLGGAIEGFKSQLETAGIGIFEVLAPSLEKATRAAASVVERLTPVVTRGVAHAVALGEQFGPLLGKAIVAKGGQAVEAVKKVVAPLGQGLKDSLNSTVNLAITVFGGFATVVHNATDAVAPLTTGIGNLLESINRANGPVGALRAGLQLAFNAFNGLISIAKPIVSLVGGLVSEFSQLPGPIEAAAVAIVALKFGPAILGGLKNAFSGTATGAGEAERRTGLFGRALSTALSPVRVVTGGIGAMVTTVRQFNDEARVQQGVAAGAGQSVSRLGGAVAAFNTSAIPAVAAARDFRDQAKAIRLGAEGANAPIGKLAAAFGVLAERSSTVGAMAASFTRTSNAVQQFGERAGLAAGVATESFLNAVPRAVGATVRSISELPARAAAAGAAFGRITEGFTAAQVAVSAKASAIISSVQAIPTAIGVAAINTVERAKAIGTGLSTIAGSAIDKLKAFPTAVGVGLIGALDKIPTAVQGGVTALGSLGAKAAGVASALGTGLTRATSGLVSALGGPWGIALAAASVALGVLADAQAKAAQRAAENAAGQARLRDALIQSRGAVNDQIRDMIRLELINKNVVPALTDVGSSLNDTIDAIVNGGPAFDNLTGKIQAQAGQTSSLAGILDVLGVSQDSNLDKQVHLKDVLDSLHGQFSGALKDQKDYASSTGSSAAAAERAVNPTGKFSDAMKTLADNTSDADSRARALKDALDALSGGQVDLESAQSRLNEQMDRLKGQFSDTDIAAKDFVGTLVTADGKFNITTENGRKFRDSLQDITGSAAELAQRTFDVTGSIDQAKDAVAKARQQFIETATKMGLTGTQAALLADAMHLIPGEVATLIKAPGLSETQTQLDILKGKLTGLPPRTPVQVDALTEAAQRKLADMGFQVTHLPNGKFEVIAKTDTANAELNGLVRRWNGFTITLNAQIKGGVGGNLRAQLGVAQGAIVQPFAAGGFAKRLTPMRAGLAAIVGPNTWRVVGDRIRDDEAYIPINRSNRSMALLQETANRMGFALIKQFAAGGIAQQSGRDLLRDRARGDVVIENLRIQALSDSFSLDQVQRELYFAGVR